MLKHPYDAPFERGVEAVENVPWRKPLVLAAAGEAAFGLVLLADPPLVVGLLFDSGITGAGMVMGRVAGIALVALGFACWPGTPLIGMLTYSAAVTLYLAYVGFAGGLSGILLWPAVVLHVVLTALLARNLTSRRKMET